MRRPITVATEPVMSRSGPMAVPRMGCPQPGRPGRVQGGRGGQVVQAGGQRRTAGELAGEAGVQGDAVAEQRADRGGGQEHGHQVWSASDT